MPGGINRYLVGFGYLFVIVWADRQLTGELRKAIVQQEKWALALCCFLANALGVILYRIATRLL